LESRSLRLLEFLDNRHMQVVRLSALRTGRLYPQKRFLVRELKYASQFKHRTLQTTKNFMITVRLKLDVNTAASVSKNQEKQVKKAR
jgi:hypothetical protein